MCSGVMHYKLYSATRKFINTYMPLSLKTTRKRGQNFEAWFTIDTNRARSKNNMRLYLGFAMRFLLQTFAIECRSRPLNECRLMIHHMTLFVHDRNLTWKILISCWWEVVAREEGEHNIVFYIICRVFYIKSSSLDEEEVVEVVAREYFINFLYMFDVEK
jgi:hypothetical protein